MVSNRGNTELLKNIQMGAKKVSERNGLASLGVVKQTQPVQEGGAYASIQKMNKQVNTIPNSVIDSALARSGFFKESAVPSTNHSESVSNNVIFSGSNILENRLLSRLCESVETLGVTKEYFNAVSSLFTLYTMDSLNESLMDSISREDLREIKGIIREFKSAIDAY